MSFRAGTRRNDDYKFRSNETEITGPFWDALNASLDENILSMKLEMLFAIKIGVAISVQYSFG